MTDYVLESRCCGTKFADEKWELDCPNRDGAALIFANYAKKQLEVKENLPGLYKYSDWLPVVGHWTVPERLSHTKVKGWPANWDCRICISLLTGIGLKRGL